MLTHAYSKQNTVAIASNYVECQCSKIIVINIRSFTWIRFNFRIHPTSENV